MTTFWLFGAIRTLATALYILEHVHVVIVVLPEEGE